MEEASEAPVEREQCWLCLYQNDDEAKKVTEFVVKSVGYIDIGNISSQVSTFIKSQYEAPVDANGEKIPLLGAEPEHIYKHVTKHILHPRVRIAVLLKVFFCLVLLWFFPYDTIGHRIC